MKKISYYIYMVVVLTTAIFTGCTDDDKSESLFTGELNIFDFAPTTGKGGTQLLINGEQFALDANAISVSINGVELTILQSNEEQLLVEIPDNELVDNAPLKVTVDGKTVQSKAKFAFQKAAIASYSPSMGKVGTEVSIYISNLPTEIINPAATYKDVEAACVFDVEKSCFLVTIPELTEEGTFPIVLSFSGRMFSIDFEYDDAPVFERTITTLPGSDVLSIRSSIWEGADASRFGSIAVDDNGNVYVGELGNLCITKITPDGKLSRVAGQGKPNPDWSISWRFTEGGSYEAEIRPADIKVDGIGNMYACDNWIGTSAFFEPDGKAHFLGNPASITIAIDKKNNRFYSRNADCLFMKDLDDYGTSVKSQGNWLYDIWDIGGMDVDKNTGDLYAVKSRSNQIIRFPYTETGLGAPEVIAGSGVSGNSNGPRLEASFASPWGIAVTPDGNILVAGNGARVYEDGLRSHIDQSIRYIDMKTGMVTTFAGSATSGNEDGMLTLPAYAGISSAEQTLPASFGAPSAVCVAKDGTVYVLDRLNNCVKKITTVEK